VVTKEQPVTAGTGGVRTVAELPLARAERKPDRLGYSFLSDGETDEVGLSYARPTAVRGPSPRASAGRAVCPAPG
jgi:hypothetical protein